MPIPDQFSQAARVLRRLPHKHTFLNELLPTKPNYTNQRLTQIN
jgi:hypothetical protein